jgi:hypothetical protein
MDPVTRSLRVELDVDSQGGKILPGAYAEVHIVPEADRAGLDLPASTLMFPAGGASVAIVDQNGKVAIQKIQLGRDFGSHVEVLGGLAASAKVIVNPGMGSSAARASECLRRRRSRLKELNREEAGHKCGLCMASGMLFRTDLPHSGDGSSSKVCRSERSSPESDSAEWWTSYHDDDLDALIRRIDVTNQTLKKSIALLQDSRAQADAARAAYFPTAGANASATSSHVSANVVGRSLAGKTTPDRLIGFSATWEPDLFGRIGNAVDAATSRVQANADDVAAVRLTLQAEVATDYFAIRSLDREASLLRQTVDAYSSVLSMVTNRYKGGIAAESDVAQAQAQRDSTKAQLADLTLARTQLQHALATLVGEPASTFSIAPHDAYGTQLPEIPAAVPSELLKRRPDIAAVERRVSAANSQIGVAKAAFFRVSCSI